MHIPVTEFKMLKFMVMAQKYVVFGHQEERDVR